MAASTLHVSVGMLTATLVTLPGIRRAWKEGRPLNALLARWYLLSAALGLYAVLPSILRRITGMDDIGRSAIWNLFLFYALVDWLPAPRILIGELAVGCIYALQYGILLLSIRRARAREASRG